MRIITSSQQNMMHISKILWKKTTIKQTAAAGTRSICNSWHSCKVFIFL